MTVSRYTKRKIKKLVIFIFVMLFAGVIFLNIFSFVQGSRPQEVRPVSVLTGEWEPFVGSELDEGGPIAKVVKEALEGAGFEAVLSFSTWDVIDKRVAGASTFGGFPMVSSQSRSERMIASDPIFSFRYVMYIRAGDENFPRTQEELMTKKVGGVRGYDYWDELQDSVSIIEYKSIEEAFEALGRGEIDIFVEGELPAKAALAKPHLDLDATNFKAIDTSYEWASSEQDLFFMMPDNDETRKVMGVINGALANYKTTQEYAAIVETLETGRQDTVKIVTGVAGELTEVKDLDGGSIGKTPAGVLAGVLEWPEEMVSGSELVRVKFLTGPLSGSIGFIPVTSVEVVS